MVRLDRVSRVGTLGFVVAALLGGVLIAAAGRRDGRDPGGSEGERLGKELERETRTVIAHVKEKYRVIEELLLGRLTLLEAAALFRALDQSLRSFNWEQFRLGYPGDSDEERHCREVIRWVRIELESTDPCLSIATQHELERKLQEHLRRGTLLLPE
jgi:hypothetical protein